MTKPKFVPRYKAGEWIVVAAGFGRNENEYVRKAAERERYRSDIRYIHHATEREVELAIENIEWQKNKDREYQAKRATQPYQDASCILCQTEDVLITKLGPELLSACAKRLR